MYTQFPTYHNILEFRVWRNPRLLKNAVPGIELYLSRLVIYRYFLAVIEPNLITAVMVKLIFDILPKRPSCKVVGFSTLSMVTLDALAKSGLTVSDTLLE